VLIALARGHQHQNQHQKQSLNGPKESLESVPTKLDLNYSSTQQTATDFEVRLLPLARNAGVCTLIQRVSHQYRFTC
jgi:hypothetical protein